MKLKPVRVTWTDPEAHGSGWHKFKALRKEARGCGATCIAAGFLLLDEAKYITIVQSISGNKGGECITIPRSLIKSIKRLS